MVQVAIVVSDIDKALAFEWIANQIDPQKIKLHFFLLNKSDSYLEFWLKEKQIDVYRIKYKSKFDLPLATIKLFYYFAKLNIQVVHCHLFEASLAGLVAAKLAGVPKRVLTRHYAALNHYYYPKIVQYDIFCNTLSTHIIAPSETVQKVLIEKENVHPDKIKVIYHGFDLESFAHPELVIVEKLKFKYNPNQRHPVIGVIARYTELKGIQYIIPAFKNLLYDFPHAILILANTRGDFSHEIKRLLKSLPPNSFVEIDFENDIEALYHTFDVYVHTPIAADFEGFGQTYVESLASGIPSVFTLSGIASSFIENDKNALVVGYKNSDQIYKAIINILKDDYLRDVLISNGKISANQYFKLEYMIEKLSKLYLSK
ncbi:MAG: glycosyltransferase family 4 protein [Bacteroidota bacterium]|nr:glycosyltransferase family 4 protein [Bacteroidota bacterium]